MKVYALAAWDPITETLAVLGVYSTYEAALAAEADIDNPELLTTIQETEVE